MAIGWPSSELAQRIGRASGAFGPMLWGRQSQVTAESARAIARVYDQLWDRPGPSKITRRRAAAKGWLSPLWWDDDTIDDPTYTPDTREHWGRDSIDPVAVDLAIAGRARPDLTIAERAEAVRRLHSRGLNDQEIARLIGMTDRNVLRIRQRLSLAANLPAAGAA